MRCFDAGGIGPPQACFVSSSASALPGQRWSGVGQAGMCQIFHKDVLHARSHSGCRWHTADVWNWSCHSPSIGDHVFAIELHNHLVNIARRQFFTLQRASPYATAPGAFNRNRVLIRKGMPPCTRLLELPHIPMVCGKGIGRLHLTRHIRGHLDCFTACFFNYAFF